MGFKMDLKHSIFRDHPMGISHPFWLIAGPCVIESHEMTLHIATELKAMTKALGIPLLFKASFDKANRTSHDSFRGLGLDEGLRILADVKRSLNIPVITDVHQSNHLEQVAQVVDVMQTPAFLCRQTDFIQAVASQGLPVNIKKGQFMSPWDMTAVVEKARSVGNDHIMVCERGSCFGYQNLVSDMRSLAIMRQTHCPVVYDATHSVQLPGAGQGCSSGQREMIPVLARAAMAAGIAAIFMETHPDPQQAKSDGPNSLYLKDMYNLLVTLKNIDESVKIVSNADLMA